jgi:hypothetical protein
MIVKKIILYTIFCLSFIKPADCSSLPKDCPADYIDPESIKWIPAQTKNGFGLNFNSLGNFEEDFVRDCRALSINDQAKPANILFLGEAFGRLALRALKNTLGHEQIIVNDLSEKNLAHLTYKLQQMHDYADPILKLYNQTAKAKERHSPFVFRQLASRITPIVGDCLDLLNNEGFLKALNMTANNSIDLLMCSNVIHFFDGLQTLQFFLNTFNLLRPGGKAYVFCKAKASPFPEEMCRGNPNRMLSRMNCEVAQAAKARQISIFPNMFHRIWLTDKALRAELVQKMKEDGEANPIDNAIPQSCLKLIAEKLGFEILSLKDYEVMHGQYLINEEMYEKTIGIIDQPDGSYCGIVLQKPVSHSGAVLTKDHLDRKFVTECSDSMKIMERFFIDSFQRINSYPYVKFIGHTKK